MLEKKDISLYPLRLAPVYKNYIWGGNKIASHYKRPLPDGIYAESWEIADRPEGMSVVLNGPLAGRDLAGLMAFYGEKITGRQCAKFPLLVKIIDAREKLSVQVHPDAAGAKATGGEPKTEMWYVLAAEPRAKVYAGLKPGVTATSFKDALAKGAIDKLLRIVPVAKGDLVYIPGGTVHAIDAGCLLLEVQQNSDTTFRLFDWHRVGSDGKPRALQINKALKVVRWDEQASPKIDAGKHPLQFNREGNVVAELLRTPFFRFEKMMVTKALPGATGGKTFHILFIEEGSVELAFGSEKMRLESGSTVLVPAVLPNYCLTPNLKPATILRLSLP